MPETLMEQTDKRCGFAKKFDKRNGDRNAYCYICGVRECEHKKELSKSESKIGLDFIE